MAGTRRLEEEERMTCDAGLTISEVLSVGGYADAAGLGALGHGCLGNFETFVIGLGFVVGLVGLIMYVGSLLDNSCGATPRGRGRPQSLPRGTRLGGDGKECV